MKMLVYHKNNKTKILSTGGGSRIKANFKWLHNVAHISLIEPARVKINSPFLSEGEQSSEMTSKTIVF